VLEQQQVVEGVGLGSLLCLHLQGQVGEGVEEVQVELHFAPEE